MSGRTKSVLVVGSGLLLTNLLSGVFCQLCPLILYLIGGVLVGLLVVQWADGRLDNPKSEGAMAGLWAGLIGFGGQFVAILINVTINSRRDTNIFGQEWGSGEEKTAGIVFGVGVCSCAGIIAVLLMVGIAALVAQKYAERNPVGDDEQAVYRDIEPPSL